jgi:hypothetical protein
LTELGVWGILGASKSSMRRHRGRYLDTGFSMLDTRCWIRELANFNRGLDSYLVNREVYLASCGPSGGFLIFGVSFFINILAAVPRQHAFGLAIFSES